MAKKKKERNNLTVLSIKVGNEEVAFGIPLFTAGQVHNIEKYLTIDVTNLVGELVTTPVIMNRLGSLVAEAEDATRRMRLDREIWKAKESTKFRKEHGKVSIAEMDAHLITHKIYKIKNNRYLDAQRDEKNMNSLYWSFKEKQENLKKLSLTLQQGDLDAETIELALHRMKNIEYVRSE